MNEQKSKAGRKGLPVEDRKHQVTLYIQWKHIAPHANIHKFQEFLLKKLQENEFFLGPIYMTDLNAKALETKVKQGQEKGVKDEV